MKLGFVDVGGGTRGIYGAGVFDYLMEENISGDYFIAVSYTHLTLPTKA